MFKNRENHPDTRSKILDAATSEFALKGPAGARVDHIARIAGVNKAMIYYHFSSKGNLYRKVIEDQISRIGDSVKDIVDSPDDLKASLLRLSRVYHSALTSDERFPRIVLHELANGGEVLMEALLKSLSHRGIPNKLLQLFEENQKRGLLRQVDVRQAMVSFLGMNMYYLITAPIVNSVLEIEDAEKFRKKRPDEIVDLFLHGIEAG
jgi:AcrR family transcriptional regulator